MSLYFDSGSAADQPFPGIEIVEIGGGLSIGEFEEKVKDMVVPGHFHMSGEWVVGERAIQLGTTIVASRTAESPRDPWAPDHHWHADKSYWGENQFASVLYAQRLVGRVATTGLIDTALLLRAIESDYPGLTEELSESEAVFSVRRYYEDILPAKGSQEAIERTLKEKVASNLYEVASMEAEKFPEKSFPAIPVHPMRSASCAMMDDSRLVRLTKVNTERSEEIVRLVRDEYLNLPVEELSQRPYHYLHEWEEGQVVIYPQIGTLHRAMPSPPQELRRDTLRLFIV